MKNLRILLLGCLLVSFGVSYSQIAVVAYMKSKPGGNYQGVEKEWMKIHQARLDAGHITGWQVTQKMFSGSEDEYDYIVITNFESMKQFEEGTMPWEAAYPDWSDDDWDKFFERTTNSRDLVRQEVYHNVMGSETDSEEPANYYVVNQMRVQEGNMNDYLSLEREVFKPMHEEAVKRGYRSGWSVWRKWPGSQWAAFITVDAYTSLAQLDGNDDEVDLWDVVHPGKNRSEIWGKTSSTRTMVNTEFWRRLTDLQVY